MDFLKYIISFVALPLVLTGCYTEFEPDIKSEPVLCMNSLLVADEPLWVEVTRTWNWSEGTPGETVDISVDDAEVELYVNGQFVEKLVRKTSDSEDDADDDSFYKTNGGFTGDYIPQPGDCIKLVASSKRYGEASGEVTMPARVDIENVEFFPGEVTVTDGWGLSGSSAWAIINLDMLVSFTDPADGTNFYKQETDVVRGNSYRDDDFIFWGETISWWADTNREPLFSEYLSVLETVFSGNYGYTIFTDRSINGKTYSLHLSYRIDYYISNPDNDPDLESEMEISLCAISPSYYNHVLSVWVANEGVAGTLGSVGLGQPVFENSNVSTGAGVLAASTPSRFTFSLKQFLPANDNNDTEHP